MEKKTSYEEYEAKVLNYASDGIKGLQTFISKEKNSQFEKWANKKIADFKKGDPGVVHLNKMVKKNWEENFKT